MTKILLDLQRACDSTVRGFREGNGTPADLEDALQVLHDAKQALINLTKRVRLNHDTNKLP